MPSKIHSTAVIDENVIIGDKTAIWHFSHICSGACIGEQCSFGQNTMVANDVVIGNNVKVQNNVAIYTGTTVEDDVFLGPSCVLTNISNPRSQVIRRGLYEKTLIKKGATVGANATIVCGITLGRYCFISAGAVVTKDVPDYAMILGVPGKQRGWMSRHGQPLREKDAEGYYICPETSYRYEEVNGTLSCIDLNEEDPLPIELKTGQVSYREL